MTTAEATEPEQPSNLAELAREHGLTKVGERPGLITYIRQMWAYRGFLWTMSTAKSYSQYQNNYLGQLWTILSPLTLAAVYYVVFVMMLRTTGDIQNSVSFLVIGIFIFLSISATLSSGANSILNNTNVVRSLQFPRAVLPVSVSISEMINLLPAIVVMYLIVLATGETPTWGWLGVPAVLVLILVFTAGACMMAARIIVAARDLRNFIPMVTRVLRYGSGVFFPVALAQERFGEVVGIIVEYQPVALYLNLARFCLMSEVRVTHFDWLLGLGWAVLFFVVGFLVFWSAEHQYGRD
mgnify:CR=1 FL=1